ncbi:MAG: shikimate dehydrogenase [SAR86 cluster bacterium]|jgi:shikimate dehydrogenase|nr:shikimate dehydrogenase [SAR86 cluster bacterium]
MKKLGVIGHPIGHTLSPQIHQAFSLQTGIELTYEPIDMKEFNFTANLLDLVKKGFNGLNVTLPLKGCAYGSADIKSEECNLVKAANTLHFIDKQILAYSTDGKGFARDLKDKNLKVPGKHILMIGAGGSARSILPSLLSMKPMSLSIINRTKHKAEILAKEFSNEQILITGGGLDAAHDKYDAIINTSSFEAEGSKLHINKNAFKSVEWSYDLMYSKINKTKFVSLSNQLGVEESYDGFGMLICQAALSFEIWTGVQPEITNVSKEIFLD